MNVLSVFKATESRQQHIKSVLAVVVAAVSSYSVLENFAMDTNETCGNL